MGKIYEDISEEQDIEIKEMVDNLMSVSVVFNGRTDIKFRDNEINRVYNIMDKSEYRSVLLVGDKGIGKLSIVEGYINKLTEEYRTDQVVTIDYDSIVSKVSNQSEFAKIIDDIFNVANNNTSFNIILNVNNLGHFINHNCYGSGGFSFLNDMATSIKNNGLRIIATTTTDEYKELQDEFPYILDCFTIIKLTELKIDETEEIINDEIDVYKDYFKLNLPEDIANTICVNADKYIKDRPFPEKAEWLLDEVCASISMKKSNNKKLGILVDKCNKLKLKLSEYLENNDYQSCEEINNEILNTHKNIEKINNRKKNIDVDNSDILEAIGEIVGVKMSKLSNDQTKFLKDMHTELKKNVIGQDETIDKIVKNINRNKLGLRKTAHSAGNFIFIGSTGVGKTHLAKQLAKYLYGSEENLLRFDMSEYQSEIDVSKLLGSAPGYVGYKESGLLVKRLSKYPESVVLFDEIEKAHPRIYDVLLQLLDEGFVTGSDGNKVDATKALIIFTSNIGVRGAKEMSSPIGFTNDFENQKNSRKEEIIRKALKKRFSPEFLNRLDSICYFNNLDRNTLSSILKKEMNEMNENIKNICGKTIELQNDVVNWILDKVENEDNGARPIIRHLQQDIEEELSCMIIDDSDVLKSNKKVLKASIKNDKIILK